VPVTGRGLLNQYALSPEVEKDAKISDLETPLLDEAKVKKALETWVKENIRNLTRYVYNGEGRLVRP